MRYQSSHHLIHCHRSHRKINNAHMGKRLPEDLLTTDLVCGSLFLCGFNDDNCSTSQALHSLSSEPSYDQERSYWTEVPEDLLTTGLVNGSLPLRDFDEREEYQPGNHLIHCHRNHRKIKNAHKGKRLPEDLLMTALVNGSMNPAPDTALFLHLLCRI